VPGPPRNTPIITFLLRLCVSGDDMHSIGNFYVRPDHGYFVFFLFFSLFRGPVPVEKNTHGPIPTDTNTRISLVLASTGYP